MAVGNAGQPSDFLQLVHGERFSLDREDSSHHSLISFLVTQQNLHRMPDILVTILILNYWTNYQTDL